MSNLVNWNRPDHKEREAKITACVFFASISHCSIPSSLLRFQSRIFSPINENPANIPNMTISGYSPFGITCEADQRKKPHKIGCRVRVTINPGLSGSIPLFFAAMDKGLGTTKPETNNMHAKGMKMLGIQ